MLYAEVLDETVNHLWSARVEMFMESKARSERLATGAGASSITAALAGMVSAICCAGPFAYLLLGASGALMAARIAPARPYLIAGSALVIAVGFYLSRRRDGACRTRHPTAPTQPPLQRTCRTRSSSWARAVLWAAAALTLTAIVLPEFVS